MGFEMGSECGGGIKTMDFLLLALVISLAVLFYCFQLKCNLHDSQQREHLKRRLEKVQPLSKTKYRNESTIAGIVPKLSWQPRPRYLWVHTWTRHKIHTNLRLLGFRGGRMGGESHYHIVIRHIKPFFYFSMIHFQSLAYHKDFFQP